MKKYLMLLGMAVLAVSLGACGFHHKKQQMMNEGLGTLLERKLDLSEEQVVQIDALTKGKMADVNQRAMQLMGRMLDLDTTSADYEQRSRELASEGAQMIERDLLDFAQTRASVLKILNEEQRVKLKEMREKMAKKYARYHAGHTPE